MAFKGMTATYTDGTPVVEGDKVRYHQQPGGMMAHGDWRYGVAATYPEQVANPGKWQDANELYLRDDKGSYYGMTGHVIERA